MKILFESKQLNEGPGAGYTVSGTLTNVVVHKIVNVEKVGGIDLLEYRIDVEADAEFVDVEANSYYYGGEIGSTPVHISSITLETTDGDISTADVKWALTGAKIEANLGGGWSHSTFDGIIDVDYNGIENSDGLLAVSMEMIDKEDVNYLDRAVQGDEEDDMDESLKESKKSRTVVLDNFNGEYVNDPEFLSTVTEILGPDETYGGSIKQIKDFAITVTVNVGTDMTTGSYGCKFKALIDGDFDSDYESEKWVEFDLSRYDNLVYQCWWEKESGEDEYYPTCDVIMMYRRDISSDIINAYLQVDGEAIMYMLEPIETALYDYVPSPDDFDESLQESLDDKELDDMAAFLDKFFAKQKIDDIIINVKDGHLFAKDSEGNKWKDAELFDFIMNEVLAFDSEGNLSDGLGAAEPFVERLKAYASKFGVTITPIKESLKESEDTIEKETDDGLGRGSAKEMSNVIFDTLFNNTQYPQFDFSKVENQEVDANKGQIVFDYMGHEYKITVEESAGHFTEAVSKNLTEDFDEDERIQALAEYLEIDPSEISNIYDNEFETPEGDYLVVDEYEAEQLARDDIENLFDDLGLDSFTSDFKDWIIMNALDNEWFEDAIKESYEYYVEDIEDESSSMGYENRLIEEMHDHQVLSDDDFEEDEDGEPDLSTLKDYVDIDDKKEEFIDLLVEDAGNAVDYCGYNYGWDWVTKMATQHNLIDMGEVVDQAIYEDGIAHFISRYDGKEHELGNGLFAYRTN